MSPGCQARASDASATDITIELYLYSHLVGLLTLLLKKAVPRDQIAFPKLDTSTASEQPLAPIKTDKPSAKLHILNLTIRSLGQLLDANQSDQLWLSHWRLRTLPGIPQK